MSDKPWEVWSGPRSFEERFETLDDAERFAKRSVRIAGNPRDIRHEARLVATVRRDALGRMWVDVLDSTLA